MVTNLKQKSKEAKRHRRTRYKRALKPLMEKFGLTSMQVAGFVEDTVRDNERLKGTNTILESEWRDAKKEIKKLEQEIAQLKSS